MWSFKQTHNLHRSLTCLIKIEQNPLIQQWRLATPRDGDNFSVRSMQMMPHNNNNKRWWVIQDHLVHCHYTYNSIHHHLLILSLLPPLFNQLTASQSAFLLHILQQTSSTAGEVIHDGFESLPMHQHKLLCTSLHLFRWWVDVCLCVCERNHYILWPLYPPLWFLFLLWFFHSLDHQAVGSYWCHWFGRLWAVTTTVWVAFISRQVTIRQKRKDLHGVILVVWVRLCDIREGEFKDRDCFLIRSSRHHPPFIIYYCFQYLDSEVAGLQLMIICCSRFQHNIAVVLSPICNILLPLQFVVVSLQRQTCLDPCGQWWVLSNRMRNFLFLMEWWWV